MQTQIEPTTNSVKRFLDLIQAGIKAWTEAGRIAAAAMDEDPDWADKVARANPQVTIEAVERFVKMGRGELHPMLATSEAPGVCALRRLPYVTQEKYLREPIKVVIAGGDTLPVDVRNLTPAQVRQVFSRDGIRSDGAQRAWLESEKQRKVEAPLLCDLPWKVTGKKVIIRERCILTAHQIALIQTELMR